MLKELRLLCPNQFQKIYGICKLLKYVTSFKLLPCYISDSSGISWFLILCWRWLYKVEYLSIGDSSKFQSSRQTLNFALVIWAMLKFKDISANCSNRHTCYIYIERERDRERDRERQRQRETERERDQLHGIISKVSQKESHHFVWCFGYCKCLFEKHTSLSVYIM